MRISANPNSPDWVMKWGTVEVTINGDKINPKDFCYAESGRAGVIHEYERTKAGQVLLLKGQPRVTEYQGVVTISVGNPAGCKPCTRTSYARRKWWDIMHAET